MSDAKHTPLELRVLGDATPDVRADVFAALMTRLEAFGDEFERLATTAEQKALAEAFGELVSDVDSSVRYIAEATRQHGPVAAAKPERPRPESGQEKPDAYDHLVAYLPRHWRDDGRDAAAGPWEALSDGGKIAFLAEQTAARHPVSFERLADAAERRLGLAPGQELTSDHVGHLLEQYRAALDRHRPSRADQPAPPVPQDDPRAGQDHAKSDERPDYLPFGRNRHIQRVLNQIEELQCSYFRCNGEWGAIGPDGTDEEPAGYHRNMLASGNGWDTWSGLSNAEKRSMLKEHVDWEGFAHHHIKDVIDKVIRDEPEDRWMDCVRLREMAEHMGGEGGGLDPAHEKLFRLPEPPPSPIHDRTEDAITMSDDRESPLAHVERQVQQVKRATINSRDEIVGPWSELDDAARLEELEGEVNWSVVSDKQKEALLAREVDFRKITRDQLNYAYERIGSYDIDIDERPARRLFDEANYAKAVADAHKTPFDGQLAAARDTTRNLVGSIMLDTWPRAGAIVDFGIDSQEHYEALYYPIRNDEIAPSVLDAAMGHGAKLTELTRAAPSNPHKDIQFHTSWDELLGRPPASPRGKEQHPSPGEIAGDDHPCAGAWAGAQQVPRAVAA